MVHETGNCFLATARGLGFETSVLEPCVFGAEKSSTGIPWYHWSGHIAGGAVEVQEQAITMFFETFHFRALGSGKGKILLSRAHAGS